jgi:hypothetical protein
LSSPNEVRRHAASERDQMKVLKTGLQLVQEQVGVESGPQGGQVEAGVNQKKKKKC